MAATWILMAGSLALGADGTSQTRLDSIPASQTVRRLLPQAQVTYSNYQNSFSTNYLDRQGWAVGALLDLGTHRHWVVETGLLYREINGGFQTSFGMTNFSYDYLSLPTAAKFYLTGQDSTSLYFKAGAMASTLTTSTVTVAPGNRKSIPDLNSKNWEVSGIVGAGMKFVVTPQSDIFVEAGYSRPLDILLSQALGYNGSWNLTGGFGINL